MYDDGLFPALIEIGNETTVLRGEEGVRIFYISDRPDEPGRTCLGRRRRRRLMYDYIPCNIIFGGADFTR